MDRSLGHTSLTIAPPEWWRSATRILKLLAWLQRCNLDSGFASSEACEVGAVNFTSVLITLLDSSPPTRCRTISSR